MQQINNYISKLYFGWKEVLSDAKIRSQIIITLVLYIFLFKYCRVFMTVLESRKGTQIIDPLLSYIPPHDVSLITFTFTYLTLSLFIISTIIKPRVFIVAMQAYCLLIIMRTIAIYLVPLEPPIGLILLKDPVSFIFMSTPSGGYIVKDLFFSGHVSTAMLFAIICPYPKIKKLLFVFTLIIGTLILVQHVHYTIDVVAAPFFSFLAYKISLFLDKTIHQNSYSQLTTKQ